jgi:hypothetical protein
VLPKVVAIIQITESFIKKMLLTFDIKDSGDARLIIDASVRAL